MGEALDAVLKDGVNREVEGHRDESRGQSEAHGLHDSPSFNGESGHSSGWKIKNQCAKKCGEERVGFNGLFNQFTLVANDRPESGRD